MSVSIDRRGRYLVEFQLRGQRVHRRCPPGTSKAEAEALEAKLRHEIFATRDLGLKPSVPLPAAIQLWLDEKMAHMKSGAHVRANSRLLLPFVLGKMVGDIPLVADRYREHGKREGLAPATINRRLMILKGTAKFAFGKGWTDENLSAKVWVLPENNKRKVYLTSAEIRRLISAMPTDEGKAWVALACYTGLRRGELFGVGKPGGGKVIRGVIWLPDDKVNAGEGRPVPVAEPGKPYLKALPFERTVDSLDWEFRRARVKVGLERVHFHDLRHTYASLLANKDVPLHVIGELLGHKAVQTTKRYSHLYLGTLKQAVRKLG